MLVKDIYANFKKEAEKPLRMRNSTVIGRDGDVTPRRHHLKYDSLCSHSKALNDKVFCIPYRKGIRSAFIATLFNLGVCQSHELKKVIKGIKELASSSLFVNNKGKTALQVLFARSGEMTNEELGDKILSEACELQRLTGMHPYGLKLAQLGFYLDVTRRDEKVFIKLNGGIKGEILPVNETRKSYKKNGKPVTPDIVGYDIYKIKEWTLEKAHKLYPNEEQDWNESYF
ncbi:hypothetical protein CMI47_04110 [Candidatus Pacearchaeota archaeon]|jgi:hypothetical protein|nr:hypothetical protein [Candidatus Pacearchaeota archaeon]|tara:strand:- start:4449 stop:5135 length:687 start_codon:yes stop_codon:yes gene_type:complete